MLKKIFSILIMILLLVGVCGTVFAKDTYTATSIVNGVTANWEYELNEANEIEELVCTNISDFTGAIEIPSSIDGKNVVSLGFKAFYGSTAITEVTLPNTLRKIGGYAFADCSKLAKINFGTGVQYLGINSFENCTALTSLFIPKSLINDCGNHPFAGCTNVTSVTFEDGITAIPSFLCEDLTGITEVTIPNSVTKIGASAFADCSKLAKINFGTGVQYLGINSFENCTALTSLFIPKSLINDCGNHPFAGCTNVTSVTFEDGITAIPSFLCEDLTGITEVTIPNSVTKIGGYVFDGCTSLKKITIFDNVTYIGINTFKDHNEDLTIHCYEGSTAAIYAIENKIKYAYLTRPPIGDDTNTDEDNKNTTPEEKPSDSAQKPTTDTDKKDTTTATDKLPQTGVSLTIIICLISITIISIIIYKKYNSYKDIK